MAVAAVARPKRPARRAPERVQVQKVIDIHLVTDGPAKGWVHTHGLAKFGRPELEIRSVPFLFFAAAGAMLNEVADYMLNDTDQPVLAGQNMQLGTMRLIRFHPAEADDAAGYDANHYRVPRLRIDGVNVGCSCCPTSPLPPSGPPTQDMN